MVSCLQTGPSVLLGPWVAAESVISQSQVDWGWESITFVCASLNFHVIMCVHSSEALWSLYSLVPCPLTKGWEKPMPSQKCEKKWGIFRLQGLGFMAWCGHLANNAVDVEVWDFYYFPEFRFDSPFLGKADSSCQFQVVETVWGKVRFLLLL